MLFVDGAFATPVDKILKAAGASPPSLYTHFGSKDGLVAAALRRRLAIWTQVWDAEISAATSDEERALALWTALRTYQHDHMTERWCAFSGTASAFSNPSDDVRAVLEEETQLLRDRLQQYAAPLAGDRADELASGLMVVYNGTMALMLREPWEKAIDEGQACARATIAHFTQAPSPVAA